MSKIEYLEMATRCARQYRTDAMASVKRNSHMNSATGTVIKQADVDALLTDFINFIGLQFGVDYALYASDLDINEHLCGTGKTSRYET